MKQNWKNTTRSTESHMSRTESKTTVGSDRQIIQIADNKEPEGGIADHSDEAAFLSALCAPDYEQGTLRPRPRSEGINTQRQPDRFARAVESIASVPPSTDITPTNKFQTAQWTTHDGDNTRQQLPKKAVAAVWGTKVFKGSRGRYGV